MQKQLLSLLAISAAIFSIHSVSMAQENACKVLFENAAPTESRAAQEPAVPPLNRAPAVGGMRRTEDIPALRIMTYNVENLFFTVGEHKHVSPNKRQQVSPPEQKSPGALAGVAKAILEADADIIVLEEIEGLESLLNFNKFYLKNAYVPYLIPGNDARGIEIAYLVRKDLPLKVVEETHKDVTWKDPIDEYQEKPLFSRDLPVLLLYRQDDDPARATPLFAIMGNHAKSQRDRPGDPRSSVLRKAQYSKASEIVSGYLKRFGSDFPLLMAGDFNTDLQNSSELGPLKTFLTDVLDFLHYPSNFRVTETFHPRNGPTVRSQLDGILVSQGLLHSILDAAIYRYKDNQGQTKPIPDNYFARKANPSDHFPIVIDIATDVIFPEAHNGQLKKTVGGN
jgi:hypothetical protein